MATRKLAPDRSSTSARATSTSKPSSGTTTASCSQRASRVMGRLPCGQLAIEVTPLARPHPRDEQREQTAKHEPHPGVEQGAKHLEVNHEQSHADRRRRQVQETRLSL